MMTPEQDDELHELIAEVLGWKKEETNRFSLPALRSFIRGKNPRLEKRVDEIIQSAEHCLLWEESHQEGSQE